MPHRCGVAEVLLCACMLLVTVWGVHVDGGALWHGHCHTSLVSFSWLYLLTDWAGIGVSNKSCCFVALRKEGKTQLTSDIPRRIPGTWLSHMSQLKRLPRVSTNHFF